MCGLVGIWLKNNNTSPNVSQLGNAVQALVHRGPDAQGQCINQQVGLGHARLSILDLSANGNQPMSESSNRYTLVFNGEIYNYQAVKKQLPPDTVFHSDTDTEVLLQTIIHFGLEGVKLFNGFFAFLLYDKIDNVLYFGRDRMGIKPLYIYEDETQYIFSSELHAFFQFDIDKSLDQEAINSLFEYTYIPGPNTILKKVKQILPGSMGKITTREMTMSTYFDLSAVAPLKITYEEAKKEVKKRVISAVEKRMIADVPLGAFLSGGLDSSIVSLISKGFKSDLKTFSVGFDVPFFDESAYASEVANHIQSDHQRLMLGKADFKKEFQNFLNANDQPFADSSAFAVYVLSQFAKQQVDVCLSGDGADELFGGYRKHAAEYRIRNTNKAKALLIKSIAKVGRFFPQGRDGKWHDLNRKFQKFSRGLEQNAAERYASWLKFIPMDAKNKLLITPKTVAIDFSEFHLDKDLNGMLLADQSMVLPYDMLTKVDRMSMRFSLEVRTPFLDHELVNYINSLPAEYKLNKNGRKQILMDAFAADLPPNILKRPKKGFEIPIFDWLKEELDLALKQDCFSATFIKRQNIFNYDYICDLQKKWHLGTVGDGIYLVWTLIVFQNWWQQYIGFNDKKSKDT
ncbi:asparagine synthase (glutamine-hydrolyzing) [Putridiphycobacter roseus]|uniref:asparagine synthase (glutamine-hydrolyzing) n=1 Tax=Putridiphycobacter roseus TaxID=2219161 RepID=UPI0013147326|nr:asparagine synthase (glutamine-hydrolyzing) [Putridiphycobacter roseus]